MKDSKEYISKVLKELEERYDNEPDFLQATKEVLTTIEPVLKEHPEYMEAGIVERLVEPERIIIFHVPWVDDNGKVHVNRGYRIQFNSAIGPYKGGLRFHPSVKLDTLKFLAFEQVFKNSLTTLPMGGGKGGSDFDPKGKSDHEIMRFCQAFMDRLFRYIGPNTDVPAGDIGVGAREVGYLYGQYKKIRNEFTGVLTGKGLSYGGSLVRTEATGYGLCYIVEEMLKDKTGEGLKGRTVALSGSGNVAIYACEKLIELGAKVVTMSDSNGYVYHESGIDLDTIKEIKFVKRGRIKEYVNSHPDAKYHEGCKKVWTVPCDVALPCATQNELDLESAKKLVENKVIAIGEGANMPCTADAIHYFQKNNIFFLPAKAGNAGGVACSGLEMSQNSVRINKTFEEVDEELHKIMHKIYENMSQTAARYGHPDDLVTGANIAGFLKVAEAMYSQGI